MLIVRPSRPEDIDAFAELAAAAGPGFTSLSVPRADLVTRLAKSRAAYHGAAEAEPGRVYLLMLEDTETGEVVGVSAVKAKIGIEDPYFNFRVLKVAQKSVAVDRRYDMDVLHLVNECGGSTEVGTLFVRADYRGKRARVRGAGRLISQARYMLIAASPERFSDTVVAELRGHVDADGHSPFWEALGRKFFQMSFEDADRISAQKDNQFILDLMPKHPVYAVLLPHAAQAVIGRTHPEGVGARRLLEAEGFRFMDVVDIFDAGPLMKAPTRDIRTVRDSRLRVARATPESGRSPGATRCLLGNDRFPEFRALHARARVTREEVFVEREALAALEVEDGARVRVWHAGL